jgi:hypothetical protein
VQFGGGGGEGRGSLRRRGNESSSTHCRRKPADTEPPLAQPEVQPELGGRRDQSCCAGVGLAEEREGSLSKICSVLLEVRAGCSPWNGPGEVLELQWRGAGQDDPFVLAGERVRKVDAALDFVKLQ